MNSLLNFRQANPVSIPTTTKQVSSGFWPLFASHAILSILSIVNLSLLSSMVAWLLDQKHHVHTYHIDWPGDPVDLNVLPKHLWADQGHASNGVAGYGFFLGIFGMITAWRIRKSGRAVRSLLTLTILQSLAILFTFSVLLFVFIVTYPTSDQDIRESVAASNVGNNYPEHTWTAETWMNAILDLPLSDQETRKQIENKIRNMQIWRWMLTLLFLVDLVAFGMSLRAWLKQRRSAGGVLGKAEI